MSTAGALSEARYAYAAVADLLDSVDTAVFAMTRRAADGAGAGAAARR